MGWQPWRTRVRAAGHLHPQQRGGRRAHAARQGGCRGAGGGGWHRSWDSPRRTRRLVPRLQRAGEADELLITGAAWLVQRVAAARLAELCGG